MNFSLGQSMRLEQLQAQGNFVPSWSDMQDLSAEQMEELAREMVESAEAGAIPPPRDAGHPGNLMRTRFFREQVEAVAGVGPKKAEFAIEEGLTVVSDTVNVRQRIEECLSRLKRETPVKPSSIFSLQFLKDFDYITSVRENAVAHAVRHQGEFVDAPYDPMKLKDLRQEDVAHAIGCHNTTISKLLKNVFVRFPDTIERDISILIPGGSLISLKGRYALGMLAKNPEYFDKSIREWKVDDGILGTQLREQYGVDVKPRTVRKYKLWFQQHVFRPRRSPAKPEDLENDSSEDTID